MDRKQFVERVQENVPDELKALDQWVLWRKELRGDKPTKVLYRPVGEWGMARSNDSSTWADFEAACNVYLAGAGHGLGFVFSQYDPFCGVDFDHCIDEDGVIDEAKVKLLWDLDSYAEKSPSGKGIHVIVKATLPGGGRKSTQHGIEIYDRNRFFTVTGDRIGLTSAINEGQEQIDSMLANLFPWPVEEQPRKTMAVSLSDQEIIDKMCRFNFKAARLWLGDMTAYGNDHSSADFALCSHLNFWTGNNADLTDRLFRLSPLYREKKWDRPAAHGYTYGQLTVRKSMSRNTYGGK